MCEFCFDLEIPRFESSVDHEKFDLELSQKVKPLSIKGLIYLGDSGSGFLIGYGTYRCQNCNTEWWYSEPEQAWRGFFLKKENAAIIVTNHESNAKKKPFGCIAALIIVIVLILHFFT